MYSFESRVRYSEVDLERKLSVTGMINYLQDCSTFHSESLGVGIDYLKKQNRTWMLSSWQIVVDRYPELGEQIVVSTWPYDFKGIYGYRNFIICDQAGAYLVRANSIWFYLDTEAGRPVRIGEEAAGPYHPEEAPKLEMDYAPRRIVLPEEYREGEPVTVVRHQIDTNHHMNNAQYVELAREALTGECRIRELRVEYKKAAVLGDVIIPRIYSQEGSTAVSLCDRCGNPYAVVWLRTV